MNKENTEKLFNKYPKLFRGRKHPSTQNLMSFRLDCHDGWYKILDEAGAQLEPLIEKYLKDNPDGNCECGHAKSFHLFQNCSHIDKVPLRWQGSWSYCVPELRRNLTVRYKGRPWLAITEWLRDVQKKYKFKLREKVNWVLDKLFNWFNLHKKIYCKCEEYYQNHPMAVQIKEKFGALRFYMTASTDEMLDIAHETERKSIDSCEDCGSDKPKMRRTGWVRNLCDDCESKK